MDGITIPTRKELPVHALSLRLAAVAAGFAVAASPLAAQGRPTVGISGGAVIPTGDFGNGYNTGYNIAANLGFRPAASQLGFRIEGAFNRFDAKNAGASDVHANILDATGNIVLATGSSTPGSVRPYLIGGVGIYNIKVSATLGGVSVSNSDTKFGLNGGAGLDLPLSGIAAFAEVRYNYVFMGSSSSSTPSSSSLGFVPLVVGVRF
jgi:hypothetical protein